MYVYMYVCMNVCMYVCITVGRPPYPERYHPRRDNHSIVRQGHFCPRRSGQADWNVHNKVILQLVFVRYLLICTTLSK